jgi:hypothetical protein
MIPSALPHWWRVVVILDAVGGDDKYVATSCEKISRCANALSRAHVKKNVIRSTPAFGGSKSATRYARQYPANVDQS